MRGILVVAGLALMACLAGCDLSCVDEPAGPTIAESKSVPLNGVKSAAVEMDMHVGDLTLTGGGADLMNAEFKYNVPAWKPDVRYTVSGGRGTLVVRQPSDHDVHFKRTVNRWDVRLRDVLPMDLKVKCQTGDSRLAVNGLALNSLVVESQTGDTSVDLAGRYAALNSTRVTGTTGDCDVKLTGDYPSLTSVTVTGQTGDVMADLSGHWRKNADAEVGSQTGDATVILPDDVGVYVTAHKGTGDISASGLMQQGSVYTNALYGKSPVTLRVNVHVSTGDIVLRNGEQ